MALLGKKHAQKQAEEIGAGLPSNTQKMGYTGLHRIHGNGMACFIILQAGFHLMPSLRNLGPKKVKETFLENIIHHI